MFQILTSGSPEWTAIAAVSEKTKSIEVTGTSGNY